MPGSPGTWTVESQEETYDVVPGGTGATFGLKVTFVTGTGQRGSVFIPQAQVTLERVRSLIAERAMLLDGIRDLTGG